jgi:hypothetical protein
VQPRELGLKGRQIGNGGDTLKFFVERLGAGGFDGGFVHAASVVIPDFLPRGARLRGLVRRGLLENLAQDFFVAVIDLFTDSPRGVIGGNGIVFHPAAGREGKEVGARRDGLVERRQVELPFGGIVVLRLAAGRLAFGCARATRGRRRTRLDQVAVRRTGPLRLRG